jgi:hypothetical protein
MKPFWKILLLVLAVIVAVKLLPVTLAMACVLGGIALAVVAVGVSLAAGLMGVGLVIALLLSPIWLPVMALAGIIALCKRANAKPVAV